MVAFFREKLREGLALLRTDGGKDVLLSFSTQLVVMLILFAANKIISVKLGVEGYSVYSLIRKNGNLFSSVLLLGLVESMSFHFPRLQRGEHRGLQSGFLSVVVLLFLGVFSLLLSILLLFPARVSDLLFASSTDRAILYVSFFYAVSLAVSQLMVAFYRASGSYRLWNLMSLLIQLLVLVTFLLASDSVVELFTCISLSNLAVAAYIAIRERRFFSFRWRPIRAMLPRMAIYGFPRMLSTLTYYVLDLLPLLIIVDRLGNQAGGYFAAVMSMQLLVTPLFAFLSPVLLQRLASLRSEGKFHLIFQLVRKASIVYVGVATLGYIALVVLARFIILILFTEEFMPACALLPILSLSLIPRSVYFLLSSALDAISVKPYSFYALLAWLVGLYGLLYFATTLEHFAWSYTLSSFIPTLLVVFFWVKQKRRRLPNPGRV